MKLVHIMDGPPLYTNCFLVIGAEGNAAAIDPNAKASRFKDALEENGATLTHILLTHGHHDHIASVDMLRTMYGAKLYMNKADAEQFGLAADGYYTEGTAIEVDDLRFVPIFTPGHTPGSTCLLCGNTLFSGDTLFAGDIGRCDLPGGDFSEMKRSLKKLCAAVPDSAEVLPGHEEFSTMADEKRNNPYIREACKS